MNTSELEHTRSRHPHAVSVLYARNARPAIAGSDQAAIARCTAADGRPTRPWSRVAAALVLALPACALASNHGNDTPDLPWANDRPKQCCGTIATSNLLIQVDQDAGRTVKDGASNEDVQDEVEKETNDDSDTSTVDNLDVVNGVRSILKKRGYKAVVESILQEGEDEITFSRLVKEFNDDERILLLVESTEEGADADDGIGHWVTITGVDESGKKISVTDPNTRGDQSDNPGDPGTADTYDVDTADFRFTLGYDFGGEKKEEGSTRVKVIDMVKVSDVEDDTGSTEETGGGGSGETGTDIRGGKARAAISEVVIDSLFEDASSPGGVDPAFSGDPILGSILRIDELTLENPFDVSGEGALLSGGVLEITQGANVLLSASFEWLTMADTNGLLANQAVLEDLVVSNTINSPWLDQYASQFASDPDLVPQLVLVPQEPSQSLLAQLDFFQSVPAGPVGVGAFLAASTLEPSVRNDVRSVTGRSLAAGIALPEPASGVSAAFGLVVLAAAARRRGPAPRA